ncbi:hypothetical protein T492DRAFT_836002 [Pavlovales sp. CCMP2436]|nr:hypothetical protein T492DRAFT_836002 [Pavlovales sp. CCMP2436]
MLRRRMHLEARCKIGRRNFVTKAVETNVGEAVWGYEQGDEWVTLEGLIKLFPDFYEMRKREVVFSVVDEKTTNPLGLPLGERGRGGVDLMSFKRTSAAPQVYRKERLLGRPLGAKTTNLLGLSPGEVRLQLADFATQSEGNVMARELKISSAIGGKLSGSVVCGVSLRRKTKSDELHEAGKGVPETTPAHVCIPPVFPIWHTCHTYVSHMYYFCDMRMRIYSLCKPVSKSGITNIARPDQTNFRRRGKGVPETYFLCVTHVTHVSAAEDEIGLTARGGKGSSRDGMPVLSKIQGQ